MKGTSNIKEFIEGSFRANGARKVRAPKGVLFGARISSRFYDPIFSTYGENPESKPIDLIKKAIDELSEPVPESVHFTGHSLGAAYGSLVHGQLVQEEFGKENAMLGDLYTFGSPRVGEQDFAEPFNNNTSVSSGSSWRIVNHNDYIARTPALPFWSELRRWIHIDSLYTVYTDKLPVSGPTEVGTRPTLTLPTALSPHYVSAYYKSLTFATTKQVPKRAPVLDFLDSQDAVDAFGGNQTFQAVGTPSLGSKNKQLHFGNDIIKSKIVFEGFSHCVRALITAGPLVGEIKGWDDAEMLKKGFSFSMHLGYTSLKDLHDARETQVLITTTDRKGPVYVIDFVVDDIVIAQADLFDSYIPENPMSQIPINIPILSSDGVLVKGTCTWELTEPLEVL